MLVESQLNLTVGISNTWSKMKPLPLLNFPWWVTLTLLPLGRLAMRGSLSNYKACKADWCELMWSLALDSKVKDPKFKAWKQWTAFQTWHGPAICVVDAVASRIVCFYSLQPVRLERNCSNCLGCFWFRHGSKGVEEEDSTWLFDLLKNFWLLKGLVLPSLLAGPTITMWSVALISSMTGPFAVIIEKLKLWFLPCLPFLSKFSLIVVGVGIEKAVLLWNSLPVFTCHGLSCWRGAG